MPSSGRNSDRIRLPRNRPIPCRSHQSCPESAPPHPTRCRRNNQTNSLSGRRIPLCIGNSVELKDSPSPLLEPCVDLPAVYRRDLVFPFNHVCCYWLHEFWSCIYLERWLDMGTTITRCLSALIIRGGILLVLRSTKHRLESLDSANPRRLRPI